MAHFADILLGPVCSPILEGIHAEEDIGAAAISVDEPLLELRARNGLRASNPLKALALLSVDEHDGHLVIRFVKREDILRSGQES